MARIDMVKRVLESTWGELKSQMKKMVPFAEVRPSQASNIFRYAQEGTAVRVAIKPVSFRIKEKPQSNKAELFVTVDGSMDFESDSSESLRVVHFSTRVGYFKEETETLLKHVYGVHYDYDDKNIAHPIFHSQMAPMIEFKEQINDAYHRKFNEIDNCVKPLLANVRIPTAQMDVFAVFLQLFSDHFVNSTSGMVALEAYKKSTELCGVFDGACPNVPRLKKAIDRQSLRSLHWYREELPALQDREIRLE